MTIATPTLTPLSFEDLIHQLICDFHNWRSIETTGRLGSDEGVGIKQFFIQIQSRIASCLILIKIALYRQLS